MWLTIIGAAIVVWLFVANRAKLKTNVDLPRVVGDGGFAVKIVGEHDYLASFEKICGQRIADCINRQTEACLILENDNRLDKLAVRVLIEGHTVGYLPRAAAREFRWAVEGVGLDRQSVFRCAALIRGTWHTGRRVQGEFCVRLDLPKERNL